MYYLDSDDLYYADKYECPGCTDLGKIIDNAAESLNKIIFHLYKSERFDSQEFESELEELCHALNVKFNFDIPLSITAKESTYA